MPKPKVRICNTIMNIHRRKAPPKKSIQSESITSPKLHKRIIRAIDRRYAFRKGAKESSFSPSQQSASRQRKKLWLGNDSGHPIWMPRGTNAPGSMANSRLPESPGAENGIFDHSTCPNQKYGSSQRSEEEWELPKEMLMLDYHPSGVLS